MITGHNTDVKYGDLVLHVQTEDKGQGNPTIESLIYFGGQVVVAKRASYAELLSGDKGEDEIMALMDHQSVRVRRRRRRRPVSSSARRAAGPSTR